MEKKQGKEDTMPDTYRPHSSAPAPSLVRSVHAPAHIPHQDPLLLPEQAATWALSPGPEPSSASAGHLRYPHLAQSPKGPRSPGRWVGEDDAGAVAEDEARTGLGSAEEGQMMMKR